MTSKTKLIGAAFLFLFFSCCKQSTEGKIKTADYKIRAEMLVDSWSVHFAQDKMNHWEKSQYKEKIVVYGTKTDSSTHNFEMATIWFISGKEDSIHFDSVKGHLSTFYPKENFDKMYHTLISGTKIRISYSLDTKGNKHVIFSSSMINKE